jgi:hypothetical protein
MIYTITYIDFKGQLKTAIADRQDELTGFLIENASVIMQ